MKRHLATAVSSIALFAVPAVATACDLDGMPGFHRFNPFGQVPGIRGLAPPQPGLPVQSQPSQTESDTKKDKSKTQGRKASETPVREWERDTGNGPLRPEDKATFT